MTWWLGSKLCWGFQIIFLTSIVFYHQNLTLSEPVNQTLVVKYLQTTVDVCYNKMMETYYAKFEKGIFFLCEHDGLIQIYIVFGHIRKQAFEVTKFL